MIERISFEPLLYVVDVVDFFYCAMREEKESRIFLMKCKGSHRSRHHFKAIGDVSTCRTRELNYRRQQTKRCSYQSCLGG
jgi:hypothetical protein